MTTQSRGPFLQAALLCERALREKDDVLSIIRIVDRWHVGMPPRKPEDPPYAATIPATGVIMLKSGDYKGKKMLGLKIVAPDGVVSDLAGMPLLFEGDERGVNVVMTVNIQAQKEGLYWIDVYLDDDLQTRIAFRIMFEYVITSSGASEQQRP
ncbi:MAG: hypothetical protein ABFD77_11495 [Thermotogota bacterium]